MAELKTKPNRGSIEDFLNSVDHQVRREDSYRILELMRKLTDDDGQLWGPSIVGFGSYHYKYKSGREADWFLTGFSPRKQSLTLYIMSGFSRYDDLLKKLGKHSTGKSCLYVKSLADIDLDVLEELIHESVAYMRSIDQRNA